MTAIVKVYPTKASALNMTHPHGPKMTLDGALWPHDGFTARRLTDGSVTTDPARAYTPPPPPSDEPGDPAEGEVVSDEKTTATFGKRAAFFPDPADNSAD